MRLDRPLPRAMLLTAAALALAAPAGAAVSPKKIVASLNAERKENGIPAGIKEKRKWSHACGHHVIWMAQNGVGHTEPPGSPGYTKSGAWAGVNSVVAYGSPPFTSPDANPYVNAPGHLAQMLQPRLNVMGAAEDGAFDCETTLPGYKRHAPKHDAVYSYPGDGTTTIEWAETAREEPSVPGDTVGLPQGTTTGPNMIAYWDGPNADTRPLTAVKHASVTGPNKQKVAIKVADDNGFAPGGSAFLIPVKPLRPDTRYRAKVTFGSGWHKGDPYYTKHRHTGRWTFTTEPLHTGIEAVRLELKKASSPDYVWAGARYVDPIYMGRRASLSGTYKHGTETHGYFKPFDVPIGYNQGFEIPRPSPGDTLELKLVVHGFTAGDTKVPPFTLTATVQG